MKSGQYYGQKLSYAEVAEQIGDSAAEVEKTYGHLDRSMSTIMAQFRKSKPEPKPE